MFVYVNIPRSSAEIAETLKAYEAKQAEAELLKQYAMDLGTKWHNYLGHENVEFSIYDDYHFDWHDVRFKANYDIDFDKLADASGRINTAVNQQDKLYFMMRKPTTEVSLYYVFADNDTDWYEVNVETEARAATGSCKCCRTPSPTR